MQRGARGAKKPAGASLRRYVLGAPASVLVFILLLLALGLYAACPSMGGSDPLVLPRQQGLRGAAGREQEREGLESPAPGPRPPWIGEEASGTLVRGAAVGEVQDRYAQMRETGRFECFDGRVGFDSFEVVNDDFCDCDDGSDEPGTSACSGLLAAPSALTGFSCRWWVTPSTGALPGASQVIRHGAVNDGICDCCGGEDEWLGVTTCKDRCAEEAAGLRVEEARSRAGSKAREAYVEKAESLRESDRYQGVDGGPDDVYIAAAAEGCLRLADGEYTFEVCLFDKVVQIPQKGGSKITIGKKGEWPTSLWEDGRQRKDYSSLTMGGGEHCFASKAPRRAEIHFECAPKPALLSVQEAQVCVYSFRMETPAACHPLHHAD